LHITLENRYFKTSQIWVGPSFTFTAGYYFLWTADVQKKKEKNIEILSYFEKKMHTHNTTSLAYNISLPSLTLLEEGLEGLLNKYKGWKAAFGMCSIREFYFFFLSIPIMNHYCGSWLG